MKKISAFILVGWLSLITAAIGGTITLPFPTPGTCTPVSTAPIVLTTTGTNNWTVPFCWNRVKVEVLAGGGSGGVSAATNFVSGGSGAAFSSGQNIAVTPGASVTYGIGIGGAAKSIPSGPGQAGNDGGDSWFNAASYAACTNSALCVRAEHGKGGQPGNPAPLVLGGSAANGIGNLATYSGGNGGGGVNSGASGGGGAAGPNGNGNASPNPTSFTNWPGGSGDAGFGGAAGAAGTGNGGNGTEWACGVGSGGGGGGSAASSSTAGSGGNYGAAGGAASGGGNLPNTSGAGRQGVICIYRLGQMAPKPANDNFPLAEAA